MALDANAIIRRFRELEHAATEERNPERIRLMQWMSENLVPCEVPLNRLISTQTGLDPERVAYYKKCDKPLPVMVTPYRDGYYFLRDGHHRFEAARRQGRTTILAVCAVEQRSR